MPTAGVRAASVATILGGAALLSYQLWRRRRRLSPVHATDVAEADGATSEEAVEAAALAEAQEKWQCNICMELPQGEVHMCENQHYFCAQCLTQHRNSETGNRDLCPACRIPLGDGPLAIRNEAVEHLVAAIPSRCEHCNTRMSWAEKQLHEPSCPRRQYACESDDCDWRGSREDREAHHRTCPHFICQRAIERARGQMRVQILREVREELEVEAMEERVQELEDALENTQEALDTYTSQKALHDDWVKLRREWNTDVPNAFQRQEDAERTRVLEREMDYMRRSPDAPMALALQDLTTKTSRTGSVLALSGFAGFHRDLFLRKQSWQQFCEHLPAKALNPLVELLAFSWQNSGVNGESEVCLAACNVIFAFASETPTTQGSFRGFSGANGPRAMALCDAGALEKLVELLETSFKRPFNSVRNRQQLWLADCLAERLISTACRAIWALVTHAVEPWPCARRHTPEGDAQAARRSSEFMHRQSRAIDARAIEVLTAVMHRYHARKSFIPDFDVGVDGLFLPAQMTEYGSLLLDPPSWTYLSLRGEEEEECPMPLRGAGECDVMRECKQVLHILMDASSLPDFDEDALDGDDDDTYGERFAAAREAEWKARRQRMLGVPGVTEDGLEEMNGGDDFGGW